MKETSITDYDVFKGACWIHRGGPRGGVGVGWGRVCRQLSHVRKSFPEDQRLGRRDC